jgi:predicted amidophosphoribosyltransferase
MTKHDEDLLDDEKPTVCPHCGALQADPLDYCRECGRKISRDRTDRTLDCYAAMQGSIHNRLNRFLQVCEDVDNAEDLYDQLFRD